ncbi:MAG: polysaccharide deacetylase family protein [Nanobdellota archaeon]
MKTAYLTINDAPSEDFINKVNYLYANDIPAVFFCEGQKLEKNPHDAIFAIKRGFMLGNHSYSHRDFSTLSYPEAKAEIVRTEEIIDTLYDCAGVEKKHKYFRYPFLKRSHHGLLEKLGYIVPFKDISYEWFSGNTRDFMYTYDSLDWAYTEGDPTIASVDQLVSRIDESGINFSSPSAELIMMHDDSRVPLAFKTIMDNLIDRFAFRLPK